MKCISCGNLIPDASNVCPYCNSKVEPVASATPVFNTNEGNSVVPNTPSQPVLPQDQNMVNTPVAPATPIETVQGSVTPVVENTSAVVNQPSVVSFQQGNVNVTPVENTPVAPVQNLEQTVQSTEQVVQTPIVEPTSVAPVMNSINPQGEVIDGTKIASTKPQPEKKKSKKGLVIGLIIALVILAIGGFAVFAYFYEFKSADKRVEAVISNLFNASSMKNNASNKASGNYNLDVKFETGETKASGSLKGTYAIDLENKVMDYTFDLESLNLGGELITQPINLELYLADSKVYVLLQNFYENYIYDEVSELDELYDSVNTEDVNYTIIVNAFKNAMINGANSMTSTQTIGDITINGVTKKTNVVKIVMTAQNQRAFVNSFINTLANNQALLSEMAKITGESAEDMKAELLSSLEDTEFENSNSSIELYTAIMGNDFDGLKIISNTEDVNGSLEVYPVTNGYGVLFVQDNEKVIEGTMTSTSKVSSTSRDFTNDYKFVVYNEEETYKFEISIVNSDDIEPKIEKVNVKNSINRIYLTEDTKIAIKQKASEMGPIGLYLPSILDLYLGTTEVDENSLTEADADQTKCTMVSDCTSSTIEGYSLCLNQETYETVICSNDWLSY